MKKRQVQSIRGKSRKSRTQIQPRLERFEDRLMLTVFTVSTITDPANPAANDGSLREAILASNASTTALPNQIVFQLPAGSTIFPLTPLPTITTSVSIDGTTATGYNPASPKPTIEINGTKLTGGNAPGLNVMAPNTKILEMDIDGFGGLSGAGIIMGGGGGTVSGTYVGVNMTGGVMVANGGTGIIVSSANNTIGDPTVNPNVISGNRAGIQITGAGNTGNVLVHNFIGTDSTGLLKLGNTFDGLEVDTAKNTIGGIAANGPAGAGNLISGNFAGITITTNGANGNLIEGNYIGTDVTGLGAIGNIFDGIDLQGVTNTLIGGTVAGAGNVISANGFKGIQVSGATTTGDAIEGNLIGVGVNKISALGNGDTGILVNGANNITIGGTTFAGDAPEFGNIIAYNGKTFTSNGVVIQSGLNDAILSNSIYNNAGLGIKLSQSNAGVTPPTLTTVESGAAETRISGTLSGQFIQPNTSYRLQFFSSLTPNAAGFGDGQNYLGDLDVTTDSVGVANFTTVLTQGVPVGYYVSSTATQQIFTVNNSSQFGPDVQTTQAAVTDLSVTASAGTVPGPFLNQPYTFSFDVANLGPDDSDGVVFTDTIPTNSTFISSSAGVFANGVLTDAIGTLTAGTSQTVTITVLPNSTTVPFTNTAKVTGNSLDTDLSNNTLTTTTTVADNADLVVNLSPSTSPAPVGSPITYVLNIGNNGPSTAAGVMTTVSFPTSFSSIIVSTDQGTSTIDSSTNTVTINTGILPASTSSTVTITATPLVTGTFDVTATTTSSTADPNTANNTVTSPITISNAAELGITSTANPDPVLVGQELVYSLIVTNNGPSDATTPIVIDQLPANVTFVAADSSAGDGSTLVYDPSTNTVTVDLSTIVSGTTQTVTIAVIPTVSGQITNSATISDVSEIDPDLTNNNTTTTTQVSPANVGVVVNNPTDPLFIGNLATYQITVSNMGPAVATNVTLTDILGSGGTIVSTDMGTISGNTVIANVGTIQVGGSVIVTIVVNPTMSGTLIDSASVSSDQLDPDPNNNTSSSSNLVSPVDLGVKAVASTSSVLVNNQITYVVTVTNSGPATATNVLFTSTLPSGAVLDSVVSSSGSVAFTSATTLAGNLGSLAPGASATITFIVTPTVLGTATLSTSVTSDDFDTDNTNNTASASTIVINVAGTIFFPTPIAAVAENAGSVSLTVQRVQGSLGAVSVAYSTVDFTAIAGVNYVASSGTLTFAAGQTTATITIQVLDDFVIDSNKIFFINLTSPTGGASIGQATAAVTIVNTDRDTVPPVVSNVSVITSKNQVVGFVLTFDKAMNPTLASLVSNYQVYLTNGASSQSGVTLIAANYDDATNSVTLVPSAPLPNNHFYKVVANGSRANALTDLSGNILLGSNGPDTDYITSYGQGTSLRYTDSHNNSVTINLSGGGTLAIFRAANGDATTVNLLGIVPHHSKLSGSVKKLGKSSTGHTNIGTITGFGKFGNVKSSLTTPAFYVGSQVVTIDSVTTKSTVSALSLIPAPTNSTVTTYEFTEPVPSLTLKKKTPNGPLSLLN